MFYISIVSVTICAPIVSNFPFSYFAWSEKNELSCCGFSGASARAESCSYRKCSLRGRRQKRRGRGRGIEKGKGKGKGALSLSPPIPLPFFPSSLSPTPFDACYPGYRKWEPYLSMPIDARKLVMTSAYTVRTGSGDRGKKLSRVGKRNPRHVHCVSFWPKNYYFKATNGVARVKF